MTYHRHVRFTNLVMQYEDYEQYLSYRQYERHRDEVWRIVNLIASRSVGNLLLNTILATQKQFKFEWYARVPGTGPNASAGPVSVERATPAGQTALLCSGPQRGTPAMRRSWTGFSDEPVTGIGGGSNVIVKFAPNMWRRRLDWQLGGDLVLRPLATSSPSTPSGAGTIRDEVLFHELCHGLRQATGTNLCTANNMGSYDNFEEYFAIVITNMYMSQGYGSANIPLRSHHRNFEPLPYPTLFPNEPQNQLWLGAINQESNRHIESLVDALIMTDGLAFNPFRDLFRQDALLPDSDAPTHA